jgi:hypothetical protein
VRRVVLSQDERAEGDHNENANPEFHGSPPHRFREVTEPAPGIVGVA